MANATHSLFTVVYALILQQCVLFIFFVAGYDQSQLRIWRGRSATVAGIVVLVNLPRT